MSFQVPEVQKKVVTEEKITIITQREESPPPAGTPSPRNNRAFPPNFFNCMSSSAGLPVPCAFAFKDLKTKILLQVPEIPKKKVPEEKRPVPRKEEAPPPKGIIGPLYKSCLLQGHAFRQRLLVSFGCQSAAVGGCALCWAFVGERQSSKCT